MSNSAGDSLYTVVMEFETRKLKQLIRIKKFKPIDGSLII